MNRLLLILLLLPACASTQTLKYPAKTVRVVDGDTADFNLKLIDGLTYKVRCRFEHINTAEMNTPEGPVAKEWLQHYLQNNKVKVSVNGKDSFDRWLCTLWNKRQNVNRLMVEVGIAECYWKSKVCPTW